MGTRAQCTSSLLHNGSANTTSILCLHLPGLIPAAPDGVQPAANALGGDAQVNEAFLKRPAVSRRPLQRSRLRHSHQRTASSSLLLWGLASVVEFKAACCGDVNNAE